MKNTAESFVWNRQFSFVQFHKLSQIQSAREWLDEATRARAMFARCQLIDTAKGYNPYQSFEGECEGEPAYFVQEIRPLSVDYAVAIYKQTLAEAHQRFPGFTDYIIEDGKMVGERRIHFPQKLDLAAGQWMHNRFRQLANSGEIKVPESLRAHRQNNGFTMNGRKQAALVISLNFPTITKDIWNQVSDCVSKGETLPIDSTPRTCNTDAAMALLGEVSLTEMYQVNWEVLKPPMSVMDDALFAGLQQYDVVAVRQALVAGANPNTCGNDNEVPLQLAVNFRWADICPITTDEQYQKDLIALGPSVQQKIEMINLLVEFGAHVDWTPPNETTPLAEACLNSSAEVVTHLLNLGADPSIVCYDDEYPSSIGSAWDCAAHRADRGNDTIWNALEARYPRE